MTSPRRKLPKAVVDTNLFVSGLISRHGLPYQLFQHWRKGAFVLLICQAQRNEIAEVLSRPKIAEKYGISPEDQAAILRLLDTAAVKTGLRRRLPVRVRDPKDEMILSSALCGKADYLVTGDDDLLVLRNETGLGGLLILTAREFLA